MRASRITFTISILTLCSAAVGPARSETDSPGHKLHAIFEAEWQWTLQTQPARASRLGDVRYNDRWPDVSLAAIDQRHQHRKRVLEQLHAIDSRALSEADKINYRLFHRQYLIEVEGHQYRQYLLPLTQRGGIQDASSLADSLRFEKPRDYQDWLKRMQRLPAYMDQTLALMQGGIDARIVHSKVVMQRVPEQIRRQIVEDQTDSLFFKPFAEMPDSIQPDDRRRLVDEAKETIRLQVVPAYRRMLAFFEDEYLPACFDEVGAWQMPLGRELYAFLARDFTTTDLTPVQIYEIGLAEVARIRGEMQKVVEQVKWKGSFNEFLEYLRTDPKFYYQDPVQLLNAYRVICKRIDPELVKLFRTLPRIPYGVEPIPMHLAPDTTTAYYQPPAADGSRAGTYFVNLYQPGTRPKYEMEVLSTHEAVPGHHLQISLAMELEDLPAFRRYGGYTAYVEGWALYCESLGEELGLYADPYSKFGQLTYEMWRAVRLVVDPGIHHYRWPRQRAIDFFAANTAKTLPDIENEIDRYISWPGQALAYKIGELKIQQLRARAEGKLVHKFDVRGFHDVLLKSGAVTLDVLESNVENWISAETGGD